MAEQRGIGGFQSVSVNPEEMDYNPIINNDLSQQKTSLTRKEYTRVANNWIRQNKEIFQAIRAATNNKPFPVLNQILTRKYGIPFWRDKQGRSEITGLLPTLDDPGVEFKPENKGNNTVGYKSVITRKETRGNPSRSTMVKVSTPNLTREQHRAFSTIMAHAASENLEGDHIVPLYRTFNAVKNMTTKRAVQYFRNLMKVGVYTGNQAENIQPLNRQQHQDKHKVESLMDKSIQDAGQKLKIFGGQNKKKTKLLKNRINPQDRLTVEQSNYWSDPLLITPSIRTLDKSFDIRL